MTTNQEKYYETAEKLASELLDASTGKCPISKYDNRSCADCSGDEHGCDKAITEWLKEETNDN